jgi:hypothetical protein
LARTVWKALPKDYLIREVVIVEGDPLQDIWTTQNIKMVILHGQVVHTTDSQNPIPGPTTLRVRGQGGMWPFHRVLLNGHPLPTSFVSKDELKATIPPEAIPTAGTYIVTLRCEGEDFPESHRAHLVVGFKP